VNQPSPPFKATVEPSAFDKKLILQNPKQVVILAMLKILLKLMLL